MDSVAQLRKQSLGDAAILSRAVLDSFRKLDPRLMLKNPVMFVVEVGAVLTTIQLVWNARHHAGSFGFELQITLWLWFTVLFANFAEAMAEGRGKAQADTLRKARAETQAHRLRPDGTTEAIPSSKLRSGDVVIVGAGEFIPGDGEVVEGVASVDESAITGESAPVIRESGGDRSAVTGGTRVLSDEIKVCITSNPGQTFLDRMIKLVEGASRQKTPNEIALNILLAGLTIILLLAVVTLQPFAVYSRAPQTIFVLVSLLVCLIPTTIGGLLSAIGIAGMDRLIQRNVIAMSGRAVEASGDVDVLLLDKTGTITLGNRAATHFYPAPGIDEHYLADAAQLSSLADETPEGRSIVVLAKERYNLRGRDLAVHPASFIPFSAQTRMSGIDIDGREIRKGAPEAVAKFIQDRKSTRLNSSHVEISYAVFCLKKKIERGGCAQVLRLPQHVRLQLAQARAGVDAELLDEHAARLAPERERVGLAAAAVEREREQPPDPLAPRVLGDVRVEVGNGGSRAPEVEQRLGPPFFFF